MRLFLNLFFIIFFNLLMFSEELNMLGIKLARLEKELSLNEEQKVKMLEIIRKENEELIRPVIYYDIVNDSLEKIIKSEKEVFEKKENVFKNFLKAEQVIVFQSSKADSVKEKLTLFLSKGLELNDRQTLLLYSFTSAAVKKLFIAKGNSSPNYEPSNEVVKKINGLITVYEQEVIKILSPAQKKLYDENRKNIMQFIIKDVLGFEEKDENKERRKKLDNIPGSISF